MADYLTTPLVLQATPSFDVHNRTDETNAHPSTNRDTFRHNSPTCRPRYSYKTLVRCAIHNSPDQKLRIQQIYHFIERKFPYYKNAPKVWKNSLRRTLSINPCFVKVPRPQYEPGKGCYWTVVDNEACHNIHVIPKKNEISPKIIQRDLKTQNLLNDLPSSNSQHMAISVATETINPKHLQYTSPCINPHPSLFDVVPLSQSPINDSEIYRNNTDWNGASSNQRDHLQRAMSNQIHVSSHSYVETALYPTSSSGVAPMNFVPPDDIVHTFPATN
ncbi:hypothetical protein F5877DRAFT_67715 [Lentinula edodes]|nr:hypothetical protein F5877DRAFT_67715 [Lentinula edodes]